MTAFIKILLVALLVGEGGDTRRVEEREIQEVVDKYVASHFEDSNADFQIEYRNVPTKVLHVPHSARLQVAADPKSQVRGTVMVPVEVFAEDKVIHTFVVMVRVRTFAQVLIVSDKVEKNEEGDAIAATEERIETTALPEDLIAYHDQLKGKRARRIISEGQVLTANMFEPTPVVNQGSTVTLIMKSNNVTVKTKAIVREDGKSGDVVVVQKKGSRERLKARVVDQNTVEFMATNE